MQMNHMVIFKGYIQHIDPRETVPAFTDAMVLMATVVAIEWANVIQFAKSEEVIVSNDGICDERSWWFVKISSRPVAETVPINDVMNIWIVTWVRPLKLLRSRNDRSRRTTIFIFDLAFACHTMSGESYKRRIEEEETGEDSRIIHLQAIKPVEASSPL